MCARLDKAKAVTAAAHKLARLIYFMLTKGEEYTDQGQDYFEERYREQYGLPVFYFSQLLGLAMGLSGQELSLRSLVVDPHPLLQSKGIAVADIPQTSNEAES